MARSARVDLDGGQEFDLLLGDGLGEGFDAAMLFVGEGGVGELLEAGDERAAEAVKAVAVGLDGGVLDAIEVAREPLPECVRGGPDRR